MSSPSGAAVSSKRGRRDKVRSEVKVRGPLGQVFHHAIEVGASDVHIEQGAGLFRVRYRINGTLQGGGPRLTNAGCMSAVKQAKRMAGLKHGGEAAPQSGRIEVEAGKRDFLVSVAQCSGSESVVLRHLLRSAFVRDLGSLGIEERIVTTLRRWTSRRNGIVIVSGVTGSGKLTMFYTLLQELNTPAIKVVAIEEPVYYRIDGVSHLQVNPGQGVDYKAALRCALDQDADLIAIGELKDAETAGVAVRAVFSGRRVLSVMHAEDAASTVDRLRDFGVEPKFIARNLVGVVNQRLVRKICVNCKAYHVPTAQERKTVLKGEKGGRFYRGKGCAQCGGTGYRGRAAVFELLELNDKMKALLLQGASVEALRHEARKAGITPLRDAALARARAGITTLSEVVG